MTTVQIIGVSVAGAAVLLLIVALLVTRLRDDVDDQDVVRTGPSFLDEGPQDTFAALGKPEQPVEDITLDPALERAAAAERAAEAARLAHREKQPPPGGLGLDWGPDLSVRELVPEHAHATWHDAPGPAGQAPVEPAEPVLSDGEGTTGEIAMPEEAEVTGDIALPDEAEVTGELWTWDEGTLPRAEPPDEPVPEPRAVPEQRAEPEPTAQPEPTAEPEPRLVPLSDIIVTTSGKLVDLEDPEVRRMLTELVTFEIDQAADYRRRGQTIDAVLQLTEAEKVSRALGMAESAERIRTMMEEIRRTTSS